LPATIAEPVSGMRSSPSRRQLNQSSNGGRRVSSAARYQGSRTCLLRAGDATATRDPERDPATHRLLPPDRY